MEKIVIPKEKYENLLREIDGLKSTLEILQNKDDIFADDELLGENWLSDEDKEAWKNL